MTLWKKESGEYKITGLQGCGAENKRLMEIGLVKNTHIHFEKFKKSEIGIITLRGWTLALSGDMCGRIEVE